MKTSRLLPGLRSRFAILLRSRTYRLVFSAVCATLLVTGCTVLDAMAQQSAIAQQLVRLHVVAESDSDVDQAHKLAVRDRLLEVFSSPLEQAETAEQAQAYLRQNLDAIRLVALDTLRQRGVDLPVTVTLAREDFPTRHYDTFSLPAGEYCALRVVIGSGRGQNWWCVMFPPLCRTSAVSRTEAVFTQGQWHTVTEDTPDVVVKFKVLEWISSLRNLFR